MSIKKLAGETAIYGIPNILGRILHFVILTPFYTREFKNTGDYGTFNELYAYTALLLIFFGLRMETAFFRYGSDKGQLNTSFSTSSIITLFNTLVLASIGWIFASDIAALIQYPPIYVQTFLGIIVFDALALLPFARLRLEGRPKRFASIKMLNIILNLGLVFFFYRGLPALAEHGVSWAGAFYEKFQLPYFAFLANLITSFIVFLLLVPAYFKVRFNYSKVLGKRMILYSLPLIMAGIAGTFNQLGAVPFLKWLGADGIAKGLEEGGIYSGIQKLAVIMTLFTQAFSYAAEPYFFKQAKEANSKETFALVAQVFTIIGCLVFLGVWYYLDIIQYILGKNYRTGFQILPILLVSNMMLGIYYNFSAWYKITDNTRFGGYLGVGGALITLAINVIFLPKYGYIVPAWATLACYTFMTIGAYIFGQKYYAIPYPIGRMTLYLALALGFFFLVKPVNDSFADQLWLGLLLKTGLLSVYIFILTALEWKTVKPILQRLKHLI